MNPKVRAWISCGFDDSSFGPERWANLLRQGDTDAVNLTWHWQRAWWQTFGRGKLLLVAAAIDSEIAAIAPLFADGGMIYNICPEDQLDFVGDIGNPDVLDAIIEAARASVPDFVGFRFYFVPDTSRTGERLKEASCRLGLICYDEGDLPSPFLDIEGQPEFALRCTRKKSLLRHEHFFQREGKLEVLHLKEGEKILPYLKEFFDQHISRRAATPYPSLFLDPVQRSYYRLMAREIGPTGWLRFTRLTWNDKPIAYHFGLCYGGRYLYGVPSFAIDLARHSPGEVLMQKLLIAAIEEGAHTFDFGIGDEAYKYRFATDVINLHTWGLYPNSSLADRGIKA